MKKFTFVAALAIAAATITSCGHSTPKASLRTDIDSMSYAMGMTQSQGLKEFLVGRMNIDTTYMDQFFKGLNEGANAGDDKGKAAYYAGIQIGQQIANQMVKGINHEVFGEDSTKTISLKNFLAGFITATSGKKGIYTHTRLRCRPDRSGHHGHHQDAQPHRAGLLKRAAQSASTPELPI